MVSREAESRSREGAAKALTPLHLNVRRHVAPGAVLALEAAAVLGGHNVAQLVKHLMEALHLLGGAEALRSRKAGEAGHRTGVGLQVQAARDSCWTSAPRLISPLQTSRDSNLQDSNSGA